MPPTTGRMNGAAVETPKRTDDQVGLLAGPENRVPASSPGMPTSVDGGRTKAVGGRRTETGRPPEPAFPRTLSETATA